MNATPVVFIHGLWLHATSWTPWLELFAARGYQPVAPGWLAISQMDYLGTQFDPSHRRPYWDALLVKHGAQRVETPGDSIFVYRLTRP